MSFGVPKTFQPVSDCIPTVASHIGVSVFGLSRWFIYYVGPNELKEVFFLNFSRNIACEFSGILRMQNCSIRVCCYGVFFNLYFLRRKYLFLRYSPHSGLHLLDRELYANLLSFTDPIFLDLAADSIRTSR